jgi:virginiamycin B lyase
MEIRSISIRGWKVVMWEKQFSIWQFVLLGLLLFASLCISFVTRLHTMHAQSPANRSISGNLLEVGQQSAASHVTVPINKQLTMRTLQVASKSLQLMATTTSEICTVTAVKGTTTVRPQGTFTEFPTPTGSSNPIFITQGFDGAFWFLENGANQVGRITPAGIITECPVPTANADLQGITSGPDHATWFTEASANQIGRVTITTVRSVSTAHFTEYSVPTAGSYPLNIVTGPDGALWFTESGAPQIGRITLSGFVTEYSGLTSDPFDIVTGPDGALWFTEPYVDQIGRITLSGAVTEFTGLTSGAFPLGITVGANKMLWFAEQGANKVGRITLTGFVSEFPVPTTKNELNFITCLSNGVCAFNERDADQIGIINAYGIVTKEIAIPTPDAEPINIINSNSRTIWFVEYASSEIGVLRLR